LTAGLSLAHNPPVMNVASTHPNASRAERLGGQGIVAGISVAKGGLKQSKRQGMAQMRHMCMCCKMSMPVAGVLEVPL